MHDSHNTVIGVLFSWTFTAASIAANWFDFAYADSVIIVPLLHLLQLVAVGMSIRVTYDIIKKNKK